MLVYLILEIQFILRVSLILDRLFFFNIVNFVVHSHIFALLLHLDHYQILNLASVADVGASAGTGVCPKGDYSHKADFEFLRNDFHINCLIVAINFVICFYFLS